MNFAKFLIENRKPTSKRRCDGERRLFSVETTNVSGEQLLSGSRNFPSRSKRKVANGMLSIFLLCGTDMDVQ